jgi:TRAP-type uncharacterized transport system substrate-binding protein
MINNFEERIRSPHNVRRWGHLLGKHALPWAAFALLCIGLATLWWWEQPTRLKIAVSPIELDEPRVVQALIDALVKERADVRLSVYATNSLEESAQALDRGDVDLAVIRSDMQVGRGATSIMELRKFFPMLVTKQGNRIEKIADLRGKQVGVAALPLHNRLLAAEVLLHWGLKEKDYSFVYLEPGDLQKRVKEGKIDALFAVGALGNRPARRSNEILRSAWGPQLMLIPFEDVAALAGKIRGVEEGELVKGYFGGNPAKPEEDLETIALSNRLVASEKVTIPVAVTLTKALLSLRDKKQLETPELVSLATPSRTSPTLPVHPGTVQQGDGTYQEFLDRYTNHFYVALAIIGGLGSLLTTLLTHGKHLVRDRSIGDVRQVLLLGDLLAKDTDKGSVALRLAEADKILQETLLACAAGDVDHSVLMAMQVAVARCHRATAEKVSTNVG